MGTCWAGRGLQSSLKRLSSRQTLPRPPPRTRPVPIDPRAVPLSEGRASDPTAETCVPGMRRPLGARGSPSAPNPRTRGQSRGRRTGGPAPLAGRGARPGKGWGDFRRGARASAETCEKAGGRQSALASLPRRCEPGWKIPREERLRQARRFYTPHPSSPHTTTLSGPAPRSRVCDGSQGPFCGAFRPVTTRTWTINGLLLVRRDPGFRMHEWARGQ